jgi:hypothetical protein
MQRFKPGQKIICTHPTGLWLGVIPGPFPRDVVTVSKYSVVHPGCIELEEYPHSRAGKGYELPDGFSQMWFEPLADINEITEILQREEVNN